MRVRRRIRMLVILAVITSTTLFSTVVAGDDTCDGNEGSANCRLEACPVSSSNGRHTGAQRATSMLQTHQEAVDEPTIDDLIRTQRESGPFLKMEFEPATRSDFEHAYRQVLRQFATQNGRSYPVSLGETSGSDWLPQLNSGNASKPIIWLHLHKQAGSFVCLTAVLNKERPVAPNVNCNWLYHDHIWKTSFDLEEEAGLFAKAPVSCENRSKYFEANGFSFGAIEREMHSSDLCPQFRYATLFRDPLLYLESVVPYEFVKFIDNGKRCGVRSDNSINGSHVEDTWLNAFLDVHFTSRNCSSIQNGALGANPWKWLDNYMVRSIAGEEAYNVDPGMVSAEHLAVAIARLSKFDQVMVVEAGQTFDGYMPTLGWQTRLTKKVNGKSKGKRLFEDATMRRLLAINDYDVQLFQHFRQLQH